MADRRWQRTPVVAWTEHDGPGRPPHGASTAMWTATAATLAVVMSVIFMTDALCPEHRTWVDALATLAFVGSLASIAGLMRGWAAAPLLTMGSAAIGTAIGAIDAAHAPVRGGVIAGVFLLALALSAWLALRQVPLMAWDRRLRRLGDAIELPLPAPAPASVADEPVEVLETSE